MLPVLCRSCEHSGDSGGHEEPRACCVRILRLHLSRAVACCGRDALRMPLVARVEMYLELKARAVSSDVSLVASAERLASCTVLGFSFAALKIEGLGEKGGSIAIELI